MSNIISKHYCIQEAEDYNRVRDSNPQASHRSSEKVITHSEELWEDHAPRQYHDGWREFTDD